jgi:hypothetical protein
VQDGGKRQSESDKADPKARPLTAPTNRKLRSENAV